MQEQAVPVDNAIVDIINRLVAEGTSLDAQLKENKSGAFTDCVEQENGSGDESDMEDCSD